MLFEVIMALCYKTKEIFSHRNRKPKEEQLLYYVIHETFIRHCAV